MSAKPPRLDLGELGLDRGGHLLVKHALRGLPVGGVLEVVGRDAHLRVHLQAWARQQALESAPIPGGARLSRPETLLGRWRGAERAGASAASSPDAVREQPPARWGLAALVGPNPAVSYPDLRAHGPPAALDPRLRAAPRSTPTTPRRSRR